MIQFNSIEMFQSVCKLNNMCGLWINIDTLDEGDIISAIIPDLDIQIMVDGYGCFLFLDREEMEKLYKKLDKDKEIRHIVYALTCDSNGNLEKDNTGRLSAHNFELWMGRKKNVLRDRLM